MVERGSGLLVEDGGEEGGDVAWVMDEVEEDDDEDVESFDSASFSPFTISANPDVRLHSFSFFFRAGLRRISQHRFTWLTRVWAGRLEREAWHSAHLLSCAWMI